MGLSKHCGLLSGNIGLAALGRWCWRCYPAHCIPYCHGGTSWSASPFPDVGSPAPLLTEGMLPWCRCVLLVDIMKDAEVPLKPTAKWTTWQRTAVSFLLSAYYFFLEGTGTQDTSPRPFLEGDRDIKLPSIYSPVAVSHQPLLLQTPLCAFVLCPKHVISTSSGCDFAEL